MNEKKYLDYEIQDFLADETFRRWVTEADGEHNVFWQKWIEQHPEKREKVLLARELITALKFNEKGSLEDDYEEVLGSILKGEKSERGKKVKPLQIASKNRGIFFWSKVAAIFILAIACFFYVLDSDKSAQPEIIVKQNYSGNKSMFSLPDGTTVTLNANSILKYPARFEDKFRSVELTGEAFFQVAHDTIHPFTVKSLNIETTALGTSFNVKAYPEEASIEIALVSGKVKVVQTNAVPDKAAVFYLLPEEKFIHSVKENRNVKENFELVAETGWKEGILVFTDTEMEEMERIVERWYGVEITIQGKPESNWSLEGRFINQSLTQFLEGLKFTHDIDYKFVSDKNVLITINPD